MLQCNSGESRIRTQKKDPTAGTVRSCALGRYGFALSIPYHNHITICADSQAGWTAQGRMSAMSEAIDVIAEETEVSTTELATVLDVSVRQTIGDMII